MQACRLKTRSIVTKQRHMQGSNASPSVSLTRWDRSFRHSSFAITWHIFCGGMNAGSDSRENMAETAPTGRGVRHGDIRRGDVTCAFNMEGVIVQIEVSELLRLLRSSYRFSTTILESGTLKCKCVFKYLCITHIMHQQVTNQSYLYTQKDFKTHDGCEVFQYDIQTITVRHHTSTYTFYQITLLEATCYNI